MYRIHTAGRRPSDSERVTGEDQQTIQAEEGRVIDSEIDRRRPESQHFKSDVVSLIRRFAIHEDESRSVKKQFGARNETTTRRR
jgi:hypothetical protein